MTKLLIELEQKYHSGFEIKSSDEALEFSYQQISLLKCIKLLKHIVNTPNRAARQIKKLEKEKEDSEARKDVYYDSFGEFFKDIGIK